MNDELLFIVSRKIFSEPLIAGFLFGQYTNNTDSRYFPQVFPDDEVCWISKNICRFPKIFGNYHWIVEEALKNKLSAQCDVKWRTVEIAEPFEFSWTGRDGFEIFEELHEIQYAECLEQGKSEHECDNEISTDPDLAYLEFVKRYRVQSFDPHCNYFELITGSTSYIAKTNQYSDTVEVSYIDGTPVFSALNEDSGSYFSLTALGQFGILSLNHQSYATTASALSILEPYLEPEFYQVFAIETAIITNLI